MKSAKKSQIQDFVSMTGCSQKQANSLLQAAKWNMQDAINIFYDQGMLPQPQQVTKNSEVEQFALKWAGKDPKNAENIGEDGLEKLFQILGVDLANPVLGYVMIVAMEMEKAGEVTKANIYNLLRYTRSSNLAEVSMKISSLEKEFMERKDLLKTVYTKLFDFYSVTKAATLDFDTAEQLWEIYLQNIMKQHSNFIEYLKQMGNKPFKVHRDVWMMVYQFANTVDSLENYREEDGWPIFIDQFVEFMKKK